MNKMIFEGEVKEEVSIEDSGQAVIAEIDWNVSCCDDNIFIRIQSWDESIFEHPLYNAKNNSYENAKLGHKSIQELIGKKIKVTIEVI